MALNDVPQSGQTLGATQNPIRQNFLTLENSFIVDHVDYGAAGQGKHNKITFPVQGSAPAFLAGEMGLFNQNAVPTSTSDIWVARGTATPYPMTGFANGTISSNQATFWTYLPSGMLMIGGYNTTSANVVTITFGSTAAGGLNSFPGFSSFIGSITSTRIDPSGTSNTVSRVNSFTLTTATFGTAVGATLTGTQPVINFFWTAIGM
jgi:hypothetical protein